MVPYGSHPLRYGLHQVARKAMRLLAWKRRVLLAVNLAPMVSYAPTRTNLHRLAPAKWAVKRKRAWQELNLRPTV